MRYLGKGLQVTELRPGITVCVAAHPNRLRGGLLSRTLNSICRQTLQPEAILVVNDKDRRGAGWTRRTILEQVNTTWFAWIDSDDWMYPNHLQDLYTEAQRTGAKYVFSYFDAPNDPFRSAKDPMGHFGKTYDVCNPHHTTITALIDTAMAKEIGYEDSATEGQFSNEDWQFIVKFAERCCKEGFLMVHLPKRTWFWEQGRQNSSGKPEQGDAA